MAAARHVRRSRVRRLILLLLRLASSQSSSGSGSGSADAAGAAVGTLHFRAAQPLERLLARLECFMSRAGRGRDGGGGGGGAEATLGAFRRQHGYGAAASVEAHLTRQLKHATARDRVWAGGVGGHQYEVFRVLVHRLLLLSTFFLVASFVCRAYGCSLDACMSIYVCMHACMYV